MTLIDAVVPEEADWVPEDTFAARLALVRQVRGWNIRQAGLACGVSSQSWGQWEDGKKCRDYEEVVRKISAAAGCDRAWLASGGYLRSRCFSVPAALGQLELLDENGQGWNAQPLLSIVSD